ncbi:MAG TPA: hypothetical protein VKY85_16090 [Candidatus Angelobacter sp.]|nr:hypothetical protein [Candidatus Angelobacter sp.]
MITPSPSVSWQASGGLNAGGEGSDQQIAVSSTHVGVSGRAALAFYTKAGSKVYGVASAETFFESIGLPKAPGGAGIFDLRMIFDEYRKRFWVCALTSNILPGRIVPSFLAAVSVTENPTDGFYFYYWDAVPTAAGSGYQAGDAADYPCIGIAQHIFVQTNKVANGSTYKYWRVLLRNADKMAQGLPGSQIDGWEWWGWNNPDGNPTYIIQPAVHHGPSSRIFLVNKWNNNAEIWAIDHALTPQQSYQRADISLPGVSGTLVNAPQKGNHVSNPPPIAMGPQIGDAFLKAVYRDNKLYFTANNSKNWTGSGNLASGRLIRANVAKYPSVNIEIDRTFGEAAETDPKGHISHYAWPGVEVNKHGDMAFSTTRTSAAIYPEVRLSVYYAKEPDLRSSVLLQAGGSPYFEGSGRSYNYYGETTAACVDPSDDTAIWVAAQYPFKTDNPNIANWSMWVGKLG